MTTCPGCGKSFHQPPSRVSEGRKHCSLACRSAAARQETDKACEACGKTFSAFGKPRRRFCSQACFADVRRTGRTKIEVPCKQCGKMKAVPPSHARTVQYVFCDKQCQGLFYRKWIMVPCDHCGNPYKTLPCKQTKYGRRYCSAKCSGEAKRRGETKSCPVCAASFWSQEHRKETNRGTFCSIKCYRVGTMTAPERKAEEWLESHGVNRERQKRFKIGFVDFYLPDLKTVVEVDGDYWHSLPRQIVKDRVRDAYLKAVGLRVVRIKECDINADIDAAMSAILS